MTAYLWHLTLDTGHGRRSERSEIADDMVALCRRLIREALAGAPATIGPGYELSAVNAGAALMATVQTLRGPLMTIAVAPHAKVSGKLWEVLRTGPHGGDVKGDAPAAPWAAVRLFPAAQADPALAWLGDFERTLAWAWIEGSKSDD